MAPEVGARMISVVTSFSPKGYEVYGRVMIESFARFWPEDVKLYVFHEGDKPADASERAIWRSLDDDPDRTAFMATHKDEGTDYRFRVCRYSNKVWAMTAAPWSQYMIWLDGDTETVNPVTPDALWRLLPPDGKIASYLARPYFRHTETGFLAFGPTAGYFLAEMRRIYTSDEVMKLPEWHDCAVFDHARVKFERTGNRFHNLCPTAMGLDVFEQSPLAAIVKHHKGPKAKAKVYGNSML